MAMRKRDTRRGFLKKAATFSTFVSIPLPAFAREQFPWPETKETEHFFYRLQPIGLYVDSQRDHMAFAFDQGHIYFSEDNGQTWPYTSDFAEANRITFSHIFANGNILFATANRLYLSTDRL